MADQINIDPVTRIEGHAKISIHLDDDDRVEDARFHVTQFRGFEKLTHGRPFHEMPSITARICGICPVSHMVASGKACDDLLAVRVPPAASQLRHALQLAQILQSHALSFFHLSGPDLLGGMDADAEDRNIFALIEQNPELARQGIQLRKFGQEIIEALSGKRIHGAWVVPGGVNKVLDVEDRDEILEQIPDVLESAQEIRDKFRGMLGSFEDEIESFGNFPTAYMGLVDEDGGLQHYDGRLRLMSNDGEILEDQVDPADYDALIGEEVEPWTYLKFPYYREQGYPDGIYRVGPLARLNLVDECGTPQADHAWREFQDMSDGPIQSSFHYHYARLVELIYCVEKIQELLEDDTALQDRVCADAGVNVNRGVGIAEAPRGTLIHDYTVDDDGLIRGVNMIIATGHNNLPMNKSIEQVARRYVDGKNLEESMLNRVEAVIRAFDPCLSCSTHAVGKMPLDIRLVDSDGSTVDEVTRD
ncbi:MAG: Ni/Fe hydrogenase subunit alpha [Planctomycetota bacterium]